MPTTNTTLQSRIIHCTKTSANWATTTTIALNGELLIEILPNSTTPRLKIGDGVNLYADLPYVTFTREEIQSWISQGAYNLNPATTTILGGVIIGANISVDANGVISIADATTGTKGVVTLSDSTSSNVSTTAATSKAVYNTMAIAQQGVTDAASALSAAQSAQTTADQAVSDAATAQTTANNAMPKSGGTFTGAVTLDADPTSNLGAATKQYVDVAVSRGIASNDSMVFMGTLGTNGTVTELPTSNVEKGHTYKVITAGTYAGQSAKIGDMFIAIQEPNPAASSAGWAYIPSGDEIITTIKYSTTTQTLTTSAQSGEITVGEAATRQVDTSITAGSTSTKLPTSAAVAAFVEGKGYVTANDKVKQTSSVENNNYPLLASASISPTSGSADYSIYNTGITVNMQTKTLTATEFSGKVNANHLYQTTGEFLILDGNFS